MADGLLPIDQALEVLRARAAANDEERAASDPLIGAFDQLRAIHRNHDGHCDECVLLDPGERSPYQPWPCRTAQQLYGPDTWPEQSS